MNDLFILIPVYQGAGTVGEVVKAALATGSAVVVVDDGSTDGSGRIAEIAGARVLRHPVNQGKGAALQTGFALARSEGRRAVLTIDADGQHDPAEIPKLVEEHRRHPDALIVGVRHFDDGMPRRSQIGNRISTFWISLFAHRPHQDTQSGFRVYPASLFTDARFRSSRFDTETELLLRAAKLRVPLVEVPIRTIYPAEGAGTHFRDFADTLRIIKLVIGSPGWRLARPNPSSAPTRPEGGG